MPVRHLHSPLRSAVTDCKNAFRINQFCLTTNKSCGLTQASAEYSEMQSVVVFSISVDSKYLSYQNGVVMGAFPWPTTSGAWERFQRHHEGLQKI
jgi:hypothetical protein